MPGKKIVRVILDTNWYISASINSASRRTFYEILSDNKIEIFYSRELIQEYRDVVGRPKFLKIISPAQAARFLGLVLPRLTKITITSAEDLSRDAKDNYLLAMARESDADYLITGDEDLLVLGRVGRTQIVRMSEFLTTSVIDRKRR